MNRLLLASAVLLRSMALQESHNLVSRRQGFKAIGVGSAWLLGGRAWADAEIATGSSPVVTTKVAVQVAAQMSAEETVKKSFVLGLYGKEAPEAVANFVALSAGTLECPCLPDNSDTESLARGALTKKSVTRACLAGEEEPVSYSRSTVWRIIKDKRVDFGQVQGKFAFRQPPTTPADEAKLLRHDRPGLLTVPRGGGSFDFAITLAPLPELDATNMVIGEVVLPPGEQGPISDALRFINEIPVIKYAGQGQGSEASRSKQCFYGSSDTFCSQLKPIKKMTLETSVL